MAIRAYDEVYLGSAQKILGEAFDFAIIALGIEPGVFAQAFCVSPASKQFARGNPRYVAGSNGCEFAREVLSGAGISFSNADDDIPLDKSPEYWAGWALCYYQWLRACGFEEIFEAVDLVWVISLYPAYHEMDVSQFVDLLDSMLEKAHLKTRLAKARQNCEMSQSALSRESGVPIRQIQLFEQRQRDINKTSGATLLRMANALHCDIEDLLERSEIHPI